MVDESLFVTGWCPPEDDCLSGYICIDDVPTCPPGFAMECVEQSDYPLGPPRITECIDVSYPAPIKHLHADSKSFCMYPTSVQLRSEDMDTLIWSATTTFASAYFRALWYDATLDEYFASGYHLPNNAYNMQNFFVIRISAAGVVLQEYTTEGTDWGGNSNNSSTTLVYKDGGIYLSGYWQYLNSYWSGIKQGYLVFDLLTGAIQQVVGFSSTQTTSQRTTFAVSDISDVCYIGRAMWSGPSGTVQHFIGELHKGVINDSGSFTMIEDGNKRSTVGHADASPTYASTLKKVGDYLVVGYGIDFNDSHWLNPRSAGGSYSDQLDIYDFESGVFIKTLHVDSTNNIASQNGNSFGAEISTYGNFILISADTQMVDPSNQNSALGAVYMYDKDFNFLQRLTIPVLMSNQSWGYNAWMSADTIYIGGTQSRNGVGPNQLKKCSYVNFGA